MSTESVQGQSVTKVLSIKSKIEKMEEEYSEQHIRVS